MRNWHLNKSKMNSNLVFCLLSLLQMEALAASLLGDLTCGQVPLKLCDDVRRSCSSLYEVNRKTCAYFRNGKFLQCHHIRLLEHQLTLAHKINANIVDKSKLKEITSRFDEVICVLNRAGKKYNSCLSSLSCWKLSLIGAFPLRSVCVPFINMH